MSITADTTTSVDEPAHVGREHVAHHFSSAEQQFSAGKLGMWLFLVTEVLFFSGLFVAYAVYRRGHPEVFAKAGDYLNTTLGTLNTIVLLASSLTMAWAVRAAQLGQRQLLTKLLALTLIFASLFLGVKAVEYSHKWGKGMLWVAAYQYGDLNAAQEKQRTVSALTALTTPVIGLTAISGIAFGLLRRRRGWSAVTLTMTLMGCGYLAGAVVGESVDRYSHAHHHHAADHHSAEQDAAEQSKIAGAAVDTVGADEARRQYSASNVAPMTTRIRYAEPTSIFFSIYFAMTGVHAVHIVAGLLVLLWLVYGASVGLYGQGNYAAVDFVGLYWHLVDLVWIYLFPLLYLIG